MGRQLVPPEFLLNWLPGYFINPACFWVAYQLFGRDPDFRRGVTWARYALFVAVFMTVEPALWGHPCRGDSFVNPGQGALLTSPSEPTREDLAALGEERLSALRAALEIGDLDRAGELPNSLGEQHARVVSVFRRHLAEFDIAGALALTSLAARYAALAEQETIWERDIVMIQL